MRADIEEKIMVPLDLTLEVSGSRVTLKLGNNLNEKVFKAKNILMEKKNNEIIIRVNDASKREKAVLNSVVAHIENMIYGLKKGFEYQLESVYSHFPINISVKGEVVEISNLLGRKKPIQAKIVGKAKVEVKGKNITVKGANLEDVSLTAANLEQVTRLKGKDIRIYQDGIYITKKDGRTGMKEMLAANR